MWESSSLHYLITLSLSQKSQIKVLWCGTNPTSLSSEATVLFHSPNRCHGGYTELKGLNELGATL